MDTQIVRFLKGKLVNIKHELKIGGLDGRSFRGYRGDEDYAEGEIVEHLQDRDLWDSHTDYNKIVSTKLFQNVIKFQAWYNSVA